MSDAEWMEMALEQARRAATRDEVPVGAVVALEGRLLAAEHNRSIELRDPTAHAEVLALRAAAAGIGNYRLTGSELFVTVEPCAMCAGALIWSRIGRLVYGADDSKGGAVVSRLRVLEPGLFNHTVEVVSGVGAETSRGLLRDFFAGRR